ncbi:MAG: glutamine-hydrolyzing GMP synthase [Abditibacteriota bacterium]|nr:glutamine-hydrolyzing GMP synthase [Abditibacteriota bacterium]
MDNKARREELVIVLDFGGQYTQLIARRVRECNVYCEIMPFDTPLEKLREKDPKGLILSGGPSSVYEDGAPHVDKALFDMGVPVLGICYGTQLMAYLLGGAVEPCENKEYGKTEMTVVEDSVLFDGLDKNLICWMSHGDKIVSLPAGFRVCATTDSTPFAAVEDVKRRLFGVQFHPEVVHTPFGTEILRNFLIKECGLHGLWTTESFIEEACREIRETVGDAKVICGVSGGVDSSCAAALISRAIGKQLTCIFVNHGLLRLNEGEKVQKMFAEHFDCNFVYVDASERFLTKLAGVTDPETKRKIIGTEFVRVFEDESEKIEDAEFLAQGTLYPDVIESGTKNAAVIKSHHNVGGLPKDIKFKILEPLRLLFKDEVRKVSKELGLPDDMVWRQPFPGPGLGIRIVGEITKQRLDTLRKADDIVVSEIKAAGLYNNLWMGFAVLVPVRSVGVMGDKRTYEETIAVRAVTSQDAMTADWARLPYDLLERISNRVINEVDGVNRVVYDISSKPPATMEWE